MNSSIAMRLAFLPWLLWAPLCAARTRAQDLPAPACTAVIEDRAAAEFDWLLVRDPAHPERPGLWVRSLHGAPPCASGQEGVASLARSRMRPLIRAGDSLEVEEHTEKLDAHLEATALEPAVEGALFRVRLETGGAPVFARALDSGHAKLAGVRPSNPMRRLP
jgi:hypothetical protein